MDPIISEINAADQTIRAAFMKRQGKGARYDAHNAPTEELLLARRGAAYFARQLNELTNSELYGESRIPGWTRAELISDISYSARSMANILAQVRSITSNQEIFQEPNLKLASTLPAQALRYLFTHTDIHLNVEFRDLKAKDWDLPLPSGLHPKLKIRNAPYLRAETIWLGTYNLSAGCKLRHLPTQMLLTNPTAQYIKNFNQ